MLKPSRDTGDSGNETVLNNQGEQEKELFGNKSGLELEKDEGEEDYEEAAKIRDELNRRN